MILPLLNIVIIRFIIDRNKTCKGNICCNLTSNAVSAESRIALYHFTFYISQPLIICGLRKAL